MVPLPDLVSQPELDPTAAGTPYISSPPPLQFAPPDLSFSSLAQEVAASLDDPEFLEVFGGADHGQHSLRVPPFLGEKALDGGPMTPDSFFDDFPDDMFDHIEPLPSPSDW